MTRLPLPAADFSFRRGTGCAACRASRAAPAATMSKSSIGWIVLWARVPVGHRGVRVLNHEELQAGDVSLEYVSRLMHRRYTDAPTIRRILQTIWYQVNHGQEIYVIGTVLDDGTVRGGTGWGAEFAKLCNKPLHVFDQEQDRWLTWSGSDWDARPGADLPVIAHPHFTGTGTRSLAPNGRAAIDGLLTRSFGGGA